MVRKGSRSSISDSSSQGSNSTQGKLSLLTPSTVRTPPADTLPVVSANMSSRIVVMNYYEHFSSSPRGLAIGVDEECLELSWNN